MNRGRARYLVILAALATVSARAQSGTEALTCGAALGFPPYQFQAGGRPVGLDVDVLEAVASEAHLDLHWRQDAWDELVGQLRFADLSCVTGMEMTASRRKGFLFTQPYYSRRVVVFVRADRTDIRDSADLKGRIVSGDRDSAVEGWMAQRGLKSDIRLRQLPSKDVAMQMLRDRGVEAAIMPEGVGLDLAKRYAVPVRMLDVVDQSTPVAIAVSRRAPALRDRLDAALGRLRSSGQLDSVLSRWLPASPR